MTLEHLGNSLSAHSKKKNENAVLVHSCFISIKEYGHVIEIQSSNLSKLFFFFFLQIYIELWINIVKVALMKHWAFDLIIFQFFKNYFTL